MLVSKGKVILIWTNSRSLTSVFCCRSGSMVWGQNQSQQNYVGQMGMGNMNMQSMSSLGMGAGGRGILGEPPVSGSSMGISGFSNMQGMMGSSSSSDNIDTMIQQRRLQQQLSLRESQLALASNLLQKQNQLIMDVGMPPNMGPMLPSPTSMSRPMIPSLLDMPSSRHGKRSVPSVNRDMDIKRRRRDSVGVHVVNSSFGSRCQRRKASSLSFLLSQRSFLFLKEHENVSWSLPNIDQEW